ncbi:hypothetical protein GQ457_11G027490 [Hibiscus cannabinus]
MKTNIRSWKGKVSYTMVPMGDFDVVLGLDFTIANQAIPIPVPSCLMVQGSHPGVVAAMICYKGTKRALEAIQVNQDALDCAIDKDIDKLGGGECCGHPFV